MKPMTLTKTLPLAWKAFANNKKYLLLIIPIEFLFLFALVQLHLQFFFPGVEASLRTGEIMAQEMEKLPETEIYQLESMLMENPEYMQAFREMLKNIVYMILSILGAWIIFKNPVWYLAHKSILKKMPLNTSLLKFTLLSLFWFVIMMIVFIIHTMIKGGTVPLIGPTTTNVLTIIALLAIYYFSQISFSLIPAQQTFKKTFVFGVKHARTILPPFIVNLLIAFVALTLPYNWIQTKPLLALAIIIIITIPALAFARLHMIIATWQKHS